MAMLGPKQEAQCALFYEFSIEDHVPQDHLLRSIDRFVDLSGIRQHLASYYSSAGRPSSDPELMIRMLLVGYCLGIRSERRLCEEVHLNLAYRWFCRLDLADPVPDHSTFSKNRPSRRCKHHLPGNTRLVPRQRLAAAFVRTECCALHRRRAGQRPAFCGCCQFDPPPDRVCSLRPFEEFPEPDNQAVASKLSQSTATERNKPNLGF